MRCVAAFLIELALVAAASGGEAPAVRLRAIGDDWAAVNHALIRLRQGDPAPLAALPPALFVEPIAAATSADDDDAAVRVWTAALPQVIATLDPTARARAIAVLDACYRGRSALGDEPRAAVAVRFLPAPAALGDLAAARDRAFDRGGFARCLAIDALIGGDGAIDRDRRAVARALGGRAATVDPTLALEPPGVPEADAATMPVATDAGLTVAWRVVAGALIALDPWDRPLWQRPIERDARVVTGAGGAVVLGPAGLRLVREDGTVATRPAPPPRTRTLAVAGEAAWFAAGSTVYRVALADGATTTFALPSEPLAPPLVRGGDSLWLTADELLLVRGGAIAARLYHGWRADPDWRIGADRAGVLVGPPGGRAWRCRPLAAQLAAADPATRARLLGATGDWRAVLALAAGDAARADPAADAAINAAHAAAIAASHGDPAALEAGLRDARTSAQRAALRWQAWLATRDAATAAALEADLASTTDELELPAIDAAPEAPPTAWRHALGAAGARRLLAATAAPWPDACDPARPVEDDGRADGEAPTAPVTPPDGERGADIALTHGAGWTEARVSDRGALRWRHRWTAPPLDTAPARAWAAVDGRLIVAEGASRLVALDLADGARLGHVDLAASDAVPIETVALRGAPLTFAVLQPIGVERSLTFASAAGESTRTLPARARWLVPLPGGRALVALADGSAWTCAPDAAPIAAVVPTALREGAAPVATADGLVRDGRCWRWRRADKR